MKQEEPPTFLLDFKKARPTQKGLVFLLANIRITFWLSTGPLSQTMSCYQKQACKSYPYLKMLVALLKAQPYFWLKFNLKKLFSYYILDQHRSHINYILK